MTPSGSAKGRVIIIGGSMAGLFAAVTLRSLGWQADIYERAGEALANRGAGIATHDELYAAVRDAGIDLREEMGVRSKGRIMFDRDGKLLGRHDLPQIMTSWGLIYRFLRAQVDDARYHNGHTLCGIEHHGDSVVAVFENGARIEGDWLLGADGTRSSVRAIVAPEAPAQYCGYFGWRGLIDEALVPAPVLADFDQRMAFGMAPGGHWLGYLVAGPDDALQPGQRWYNWGWYRTATAATLRDHLTDASGRHHENGIPHDLIRGELIEALRKEAHAYLPPQVQSVVDATARPFLQGIYDFCAPRFLYERVALLGDAAATARPHCGMGVSKAAVDAATFARALDEGGAALEAWQDARLAYARQTVAWSRDLGSYIGPQYDDALQRAKGAHHQRPAVLLGATAASDYQRYVYR
ncbi:MAG: FAD-dependent monooxygenase [Gammaproteobacteria bacterium]|nr:FAD-dependent monooxygenase [Gammaproteobacteria bacterium]